MSASTHAQWWITYFRSGAACKSTFDDLRAFQQQQQQQQTELM